MNNHYREPKRGEFFDVPTQVDFIDEENSSHRGIGYKDEIICLCCGGIFETNEVFCRPLPVWHNISDALAP